MKQIFSLIIILTLVKQMDAQNPYQNLWNDVEALEKEDKIKSALSLVETIAERAKTNADKLNYIKALFYKSKYALTLEEDAVYKIISEFKTEINTQAFPENQLLHSITANLYWHYFLNHRHVFYNRTETTNETEEATDFRTWSLATLVKEIDCHFQQSLTDPLALQAVDLNSYNYLLITQDGSKTFRPTLFDFLSHNALSFYSTPENAITQPEIKFNLDNPAYFASAKDFITIGLPESNFRALQLSALKLYQDLIQFHSKQNNALALADNNRLRLEFVYNNYTAENKDALYLNALKNEERQSAQKSVSNIYAFERAKLLHNLGNRDNSLDNDTHKWAIKESLEILNGILSTSDSLVETNAKLLKETILSPALTLLLEKYIPLKSYSKLLVTYKNISALNLEVYKLTIPQYEQWESINRNEEKTNFIAKLSPEQNWNTALKSIGDYKTHSTEIVVPQLNNGIYLITAKPYEPTPITAYQTFTVTNTAVLQRNKDDLAIYQLVNRNTGSPLVNTAVSLKSKNSTNSQYTTQNFTTDTSGEIQFKRNAAAYSTVSLTTTFDGDTGYFGDYFISGYQKRDKVKIKITTDAFLFTDRSIYRPGQPIYFKGILIQKEDGSMPKTLANSKVEIAIFNANQQKVFSEKYVTNAYGSISGSTILPNSGLNGQYYITINTLEGFTTNSRKYFNVEDYKRPTFSADFQAVTGNYKVNSDILVNGTAKAFSGFNIAGAAVSYTVTRQARLPIWYYWRKFAYNSETQQITHGNTTTDSDGKFSIAFKALPDTALDPSSQPIFSYVVTAEVTDINGETQSATTTLRVGYQSLEANIVIPNEIDTSSETSSVGVETKNLNGAFVSTTGVLKIYKLKAPTSPLKERLWDAPDLHTLSEAEFKKHFPNEPYLNEDDSNNWNNKTLVFETALTTEKDKTIAVPKTSSWEPGLYQIEYKTTDAFGVPVIAIAKTKLYSSKAIKASDQNWLDVFTDKNTYSPDDNAKLTFTTALKDVSLIIDIITKDQAVKTQIIRLNKNSRTISIPISKNDLGGVNVSVHYVALNRFKTFQKHVSVPHPETDLTIETLSFRDYLKPNQKETWSFKITGPNGKHAEAELLASMYDTSLDQFVTHNWNFNPIDQRQFYTTTNRDANNSFGIAYFKSISSSKNNIQGYRYPYYDELNWFGFDIKRNLFYGNPRRFTRAQNEQIEMVYEDVEEVAIANTTAPLDAAGLQSSNKNSADGPSNELALENGEKENNLNPALNVRSNFNETAFFYPTLLTDENGVVNFSFDAPESLTTWKLQLLAHNKALFSTIKTLTTVTKKELLVVPNAPRFLREGDTISLQTKIVNLTDKSLSGEVELELFDALTNAKIGQEVFYNTTANKPFTAASNNAAQASWSIVIPDTIQAVTYKIIAKANNFSDGEQHTLPVLSNRKLVTETLPLWVNSNQTKTFTLERLKTSTSTTLKHHRLTFELSSNPVWYAIQALPYLMEQAYESNEQILSRYYANALAGHIVSSNPKIKAVFNQWENSDALLSALEKNQDLKTIIIEHTPWLRDAESESEQKKRMALLFNLNQLSANLAIAERKLIENQKPSGGWSWYEGGPENRFITQHIIESLGHLNHLNVSNSTGLKPTLKKAISYLDSEFVKTYKDIRKYDASVDLTANHLNHYQLHYLYLRSFFTDMPPNSEVKAVMAYYMDQIKRYWITKSLYEKALMAVVTHRFDDSSTANKILTALNETSVVSDELGMYWKENTNSIFWYKAPIETQALIIEAFTEISNDTKTTDLLKVWLLKHKQTNRWKSTKATTKAIYALLLNNSEVLESTFDVTSTVGTQTITPQKEASVEAGTGYVKQQWTADEITADLATVTLTNSSKSIAWGAMYWQYFENLDHIVASKTNLAIDKSLYLKRNTATGEKLFKITPTTILKLGDIIRVKISITNDRPMEFVHMEDLRASGLEPINVLSTYKYQDGLGYYESTRDAATHFYFDTLPKGVFVFEYDLRVNNSGVMSNGITTIQNYYAPEFSSHSKGETIKVD